MSAALKMQPKSAADARWLFVGGHELRLYDTTARRFVGDPIPGEGEVTVCEFNPGGNRLLTFTCPLNAGNSRNRHVRVWRIGPKGIEPKPAWGPVDSWWSYQGTSMLDPGFVKGGDEVTTSAVYDTVIKIRAHDAESGEVLREFSKPKTTLSLRAASPDGRRYTTKIGLYSLIDGALIRSGQFGTSVFTPDAQWLLHHSTAGAEPERMISSATRARLRSSTRSRVRVKSQ